LKKLQLLTTLIFFSVLGLKGQTGYNDILEKAKRLDSVYCLEKASIDNLRDSLMDLDPEHPSRFSYGHYGMLNISDTCEYELDKLLNKYYALLRQELTSKSFLSVQNSQREWLKFREIYLSSFSKMLGEGSFYDLVYRVERVDLIEIRIQELYDILRTLIYTDQYEIVDYPSIKLIEFREEHFPTYDCNDSTY
jgi:hypothetical protein